MEQAGRTTRNTLYIFSALVGQKVLSLFYFILIARLAGVEGTGKYFLALSLTTIFSVFTDLGLSPVLTREIAKAKEKVSHYLGNVLGIKVFLIAITWLAVAVVVNILHYPPMTKIMVYCAGGVMALDSIHLSLYAAFRGLQNLKYESIGMVSGQVVTVIFGTIALLLKAPLFFLILALVGGSLFNVLFALILLLKNKISFTLQWDKAILTFLFKIAVPFALAGIFVKVYSYIDTILLSKLLGDMYVGWYSVAYKLTFAFQFMPMAFAAAMFPAMSAYFVSDPTGLKRVFEKAFFYLMLIVVPIAFGIAALADEIILKIYGSAYTPAILPLQILIFSLIFIFLQYPVGSLLNACNRQALNTTLMGVTMVLNVILNIILIPQYQLVGAAIAALASQVFLFGAGLLWAGKIIEYDKLFLGKATIKALLAAVLMGAVVWFTKSAISFFTIPLGVLVYLGILYFSRAISWLDLVQIYQTIKRRNKY